MALKRREEPSHHLYSRAAGGGLRGGGEREKHVHGGLSEGVVKTEEAVYTLLKVKLPTSCELCASSLNLLSIILKSELCFLFFFSSTL